jgi:hypothetical protein
MNVIVCLEDKGGMMFNHRRQSRDRVLNADVLALCRGSRLCISPYSKLLFEGSDADILCDESFLELASEGDFCFVEDRALAPYADRIEEVTVYKWNRRYPTDTYFDLDLATLGFSLVASEEFAGYSHEKITKETYRK